MKILHILDHSVPLHSGYTFRTRAILEHQRRLGWQTVHLTSPKHYLRCGDVESVDGLRFYRTATPRGAGSSLPVIRELALIRATRRRLREVVELERPDILHAHSPALNGVAALALAGRSGIPLVYEVRAFWEDAAVDHGTAREWGLRYRATRALESYVLARANAITTICAGLKEEMVSRGVAAEKITIIPNAVDVQQFTGSAAPDPILAARLGLAGRTVLGFIGSFYAYEGLTLLIEALPAIRRRIPGVAVLLVGGGPQEGVLRELVSHYGLEGHVVFAGRVPHGEVQHYYDLLDVLVYPRLSMRLTDLVTPLKPLEAMARGRLVVASDVGGHRELIGRGRSGLLFHAGDSQDLAHVVCRLLAAPERWPEQRAAGRDYVQRERNWPGSVARYADVYDAVLNERRAAGG